MEGAETPCLLYLVLRSSIDNTRNNVTCIIYGSSSSVRARFCLYPDNISEHMIVGFVSMVTIFLFIEHYTDDGCAGQGQLGDERE